MANIEKQKHKIHLWHEGGDWHWLHNHGATSHEGKGFTTKDGALQAAKADLTRRVRPESDEGPTVVEVEV